MATVTWRGIALQAKLAQVAYHNALKAGQYAVGQVKRSMKKGGQRRTKGKKRLPTAHSLPGQVPFVQTSTLKNSVVAVVERKGNVIISKFGSKVKYAARLEWGFMGTDSLGRSVQQLARPYLRPVLRKHWKTLKKILTTGSP